jgi:hypothetical protein
MRWREFMTFIGSAVSAPPAACTAGRLDTNIVGVIPPVPITAMAQIDCWPDQTSLTIAEKTSLAKSARVTHSHGPERVKPRRERNQCGFGEQLQEHYQY